MAARLFGATLFGAFTIAVAAVELAVTVGGLGTKRILFKLLDENRSGRPPVHVVLDAALLVTGTSLLLAAMIMAALAALPETLVAPNTARALFIIAPVIAGQALLDLLLAATRWKHKMRYEVVSRSIAEPYAGVLASVAAFYAGYQEIGLLIGYWAGTAAGLLYALAGTRACFGGLRLKSYGFAPEQMRRLLREFSIPTFNDFINALFTRMDIYLVGFLLGEAPAGIYGMARQVRTPIRQVRQSFDGLLNPIIARTLALRGPVETGEATASAARLILAIQLPILIALLVIGYPLLGWFGPEFAIGYLAMILLATAEAVQGAFSVSDLIFLYQRPAVSLRITGASMAVNLVAGLLLIPTLGIEGAALAVLAAALAGALIRRYSLSSSFGVRVPVQYSAGPFLAALVGIGAALGMGWALSAAAREVALAASLLAGLGGYGGALKLWLAARGESLALVKFEAEGAQPEPPDA